MSPVWQYVGYLKQKLIDNYQCRLYEIRIISLYFVMETILEPSS